MLVLKNPGGRAVVWSLAFSPDGERLAACGTSYPLCLWDLRGMPRVETELELSPHSLAFSPDGRTLACHDYGASTLVALATQDTRRLPAPAGWAGIGSREGRRPVAPDRRLLARGRAPA